MNKISGNNLNLEALFIALSLFVLAAMLYPYWIFKEFSTLGWYDEFHALVPWYYAKSSMQMSEGFMHGYAGGTGGALGFVYGNESISLYRMLVKSFDLWMAQFLIRYMGFVFLFSGVYVFIRRFVNAPYLIAFSSGLFCVLVSNIPYGWTIGGTGWDLGVAVWLCVVFFNHFDNRKSQYFSAIIVSLIACITCAPNFLLPWVGYLFIFFLLTFIGMKGLTRDKIVDWVVVGTIFLTFLMANWLNAQSSIVEAKDFSARIQGILKYENESAATLSMLDQLVHYSKAAHNVFVSFYVRQPNPLLAAGYVLAVLVSCYVKEFKKLLVCALFLYPLPIIIDVLAKISGNILILNYRWTVLWNLQPIILTTYISYLCVKKETVFCLREKIGKLFSDKLLTVVNLTTISSVILVYVAFVGGWRLINETLINLNATGGLGVVNHYKSLNRLKNSINQERIISADAETSGVIPIFYGLDTFDGMLTNFPYRRNYFIAYAANDPPKSTLHTHSHFVGGFPSGYDLDMFKMANVRYIMSGKSIDDSRFELIDSDNAVFANDIQYLFKGNFDESLNRLRLINPLYVYRVEGTWPRVFNAYSINFNLSSYRSKEFYLQMKKLRYKEVVVAKEDIPENHSEWIPNSSVSVINYTLHENGAAVHVSGSGVIVFNQVYTKSWTAQCNNNILPVIPVNGIMMATMVPPNCSNVIFSYGSL